MAQQNRVTPSPFNFGLWTWTWTWIVTIYLKMTHLMVTLLPQIESLLNVASAAFSAAPRVVNCTKAHPEAAKYDDL